MTKKAPKAALEAEKTRLPKEQAMTKMYSQLYSFLLVKNQIRPAAKPIKKGLKEKTEIITTTDYSKRSLEKHLGKNWPISVIYQCPKSLKAASDPQILKKLGLVNQSYFLHIGTFDKRKQLPLLTKTFAEFLKQTKSSKKLLLVGGPGQSAQMNDFPKVEKLVNDLGLEKHVILPGFLSDGEIKALYEHAFAYLFPSENEGFGIPIPEAMGFGLPVIHSDQEALLEVADGAGLPFQTGNQGDLLEKMVLLDRDSELCQSLSEKGKIRSGDFSAQKFVEAFHQIILKPGL
jgi:glycosyltransferase involved in cell wall biosynthesis